MKNRKSNRLKGYDYSKNNLYFITSCVKNMVCCFGDVACVRTGRDLSVHNPNIDIPEIHNSDIYDPESNEIDAEMILNEYGIIANNQLEWLEKQYPYISIHSYTVMPNHIHAVIEIDTNLVKAVPEIDRSTEVVKIKSLSQIIGAYKTTSSNLIHRKGYNNFA